MSVYVYICEEIERDKRIVFSIFGDKLGINLREKLKKKVEIEKYYFLGKKMEMGWSYQAGLRWKMQVDEQVAASLD